MSATNSQVADRGSRFATGDERRTIDDQRHSLGPLEQIPLGEARVFRVDGRDVAVFRCRTGDVYATSAECPHRGGPLADGLVGSHSVICPLHGFLFDLRTGEAPGRDCARLTTHRITVGADGLTLDLA